MLIRVGVDARSRIEISVSLRPTIAVMSGAVSTLSVVSASCKTLSSVLLVVYVRPMYSVLIRHLPRIHRGMWIRH